MTDNFTHTYRRVDQLTKIEEELKELHMTNFQEYYKQLTSDKFLNDQRTEQIVASIDSTINQLSLENNGHQQLIVLYLFIDQLYFMAKKFGTYEFFQRRFMYTFRRLTELKNKIIVKHSSEHHSIFHKWFTKKILDSFFECGASSPNPWETITMAWVLADKDANYQKQYLKLFLEHCENGTYKNTNMSLLTSILALHCEEGAKSLMLLRSLQGPIKPQDVIPHFQLLKEREDWEMMKMWVDLFQKNWKPSQYKEIQPFYEEMLLHTKKENLDDVWSSWLSHPTFTIYKQRIEMVRSPEEKKRVADYILGKLEAQLFNVRTEAVYYQILLYEKRFEKAVHTLLNREQDPLNLSEDKKQILRATQKQEPKLLLPLYHQFVERLVHKKSRTHYQEAVHYIKDLRFIYEAIDKLDRYSIYIRLLKKYYKSYRAFIQELKKIEQYV